ncbi:MAG: tRNA (adenosine(37)-N6)-threonylcarbamoyltransferase complex ATPase subunit type 1 TsaE [Bacteroidota bacterium]
MKKIHYALKDIFDVSLDLLREHKVFCFYGPMGAGKTTLIKAMLQHLGAVDTGSSPTFGLVNEYHKANGKLVAYHFDFYRIDALEEALDIGLEDYLASDVYIFMEWPEKIEPLLPEDYYAVSLYFVDETTRRIEY